MPDSPPAYDPATRYPLIDGAKWAAGCFVALIFLVVIAPLLNPAGETLTGQGNVFRQLSYLAVFGALVLATFRRKALERALTTSTPVNLLLLWCWLSLAWAINPGVSLRRLILTTIIVYAVFTSVACLGFVRTSQLLRRSFALVLALNFLAVILRPEMGIHHFEVGGDPSLIGDWRGIFPEKNLAGSITAMTILLYVFAGERKRFLSYLTILAGAIFLFKTGSKTSLGITGVALMMGATHRSYDVRLWPVAMTVSALVAIGCAAVVYMNLDRVQLMLDDQDSFTGRSQIWSALLAYSRNNWLLGAGYGSFWNIGPASPIYAYARQGAWLTNISSGHNGYLDLTTQLGLPGLFLTVFAVFIHPLGKLLTLAHLRSQGPLLIAMLTFGVGHNFTESTILDRDHLVQFCLMWTIACVCGEARTEIPKEPADAAPPD